MPRQFALIFILMLLLSMSPSMFAQLSGNYDIGGGINNYASPVLAAQALVTQGVSGPVTLNIYNGTYNGQVNLPPIMNVSATNTVTFQPAPGNSPVITSTLGHGFYLDGADYITIRNLTITNCHDHGIYLTLTFYDSCKFDNIIGNHLYNVGTSGSWAGIYMSYAADCQILQNEIEGDDAGIYCSYSHRNLFANNIIYDTGYYGIYNNYANSNCYYDNSILSPALALRAFTLYSSSSTTVKDNIFYQQGTGTRYAYFVSGVIGTSNYNDLYAPDAMYLGKYNSTNCATLAAWRTATGQDANSISANPNFVSSSAPCNLHINLPSPVDSAGIPIAGITTDFDGDPRDPVTPDIGADEFVPAGPPDAIDDLIITLSSSTDDSTNITLTWTPVAGAVQYHIYKSTTDPGSGYVLIGSTGETAYVDTDAVIGSGKSFYYVAADNQ